MKHRGRAGSFAGTNTCASAVRTGRPRIAALFDFDAAHTGRDRCARAGYVSAQAHAWAVNAHIDDADGSSIL